MVPNPLSIHIRCFPHTERVITEHASENPVIFPHKLFSNEIIRFGDSFGFRVITDLDWKLDLVGVELELANVTVEMGHELLPFGKISVTVGTIIDCCSYCCCAVPVLLHLVLSHVVS